MSIAAGDTHSLAVAAAGVHSLAVRTDGTVWGWGWNANGQLGDGTTTFSNVPVQVSAVTDAAVAAAGSSHSLALTTDGTVWSWGANANGQLGDGTTDDRLTPVTISDPGFQWKTGTPGLSPPGGTYQTAQTVTLVSVTPGAVIHYTTGGADPTPSDPQVVSGGTVVVDESLTLKAIAFAPGRPASNVNAATYTLQLPNPVFTPGGGTFVAPQTVTVTSAVPDATIRFTADGTDPTPASPTIPSGGTIAVGTSLTLKASSTRAGWTDSGITTAVYSLQVLPPTATPAGGTFGAPQNVVLTSATPGATIHYTTNGVEPTLADPSVPSGGTVPIATSATLKVIGARPGWASTTATASSVMERPSRDICRSRCQGSRVLRPSQSAPLTRWRCAPTVKRSARCGSGGPTRSGSWVTDRRSSATAR